MFIETIKVLTSYVRESRLGNSHTYKRLKTIAIFRCDNCNTIFERPAAKMEPKRLSNAYFHCCEKCDPKKFAQKKGVDKKVIWNKPASLGDDISKL